jgi:hypothetical protein
VLKKSPEHHWKSVPIRQPAWARDFSFSFYRDRCPIVLIDALKHGKDEVIPHLYNSRIFLLSFTYITLIVLSGSSAAV